MSLYWLVTGKTVGGLSMYPESNRLDRMEALRLWTAGSSWFSSEEGKKGAIVPGQLADLAVLSGDYFSVPDEDVKLSSRFADFHAQCISTEPISAHFCGLNQCPTKAAAAWVLIKKGLSMGSLRETTCIPSKWS